MANGTTLVEIHGALQQYDRLGHERDYLYQGVCEAVGVQWVPYAENGFRLGRNASLNEARKLPSYSTAFVDRDRFMRFFARLLRGERSSLLDEYAAQLAAHA